MLALRHDMLIKTLSLLAAVCSFLFGALGGTFCTQAIGFNGVMVNRLVFNHIYDPYHSNDMIASHSPVPSPHSRLPLTHQHLHTTHYPYALTHNPSPPRLPLAVALTASRTLSDTPLVPPGSITSPYDDPHQRHLRPSLLLLHQPLRPREADQQRQHHPPSTNSGDGSQGGYTSQLFVVSRWSSGGCDECTYC